MAGECPDSGRAAGDLRGNPAHEGFADVNGRGKDARDVKRVRFKLADKQAALVSLGRHLGIFDDKVTLTLEHRISLMTPEVCRARLIELRAKAAEVIDGEATE